MFTHALGKNICRRMYLILLLPLLLIQAWDGYQCGYCGAEFGTQAELQCHQFSQHQNWTMLQRKKNMRTISIYKMYSYSTNAMSMISHCKWNKEKFWLHWSKVQSSLGFDVDFSFSFNLVWCLRMLDIENAKSRKWISTDTGLRVKICDWQDF